jgi:hypothetical protein
MLTLVSQRYQGIFGQILVTFETKKMSTCRCVKDWGKLAPYSMVKGGIAKIVWQGQVLG